MARLSRRQFNFANGEVSPSVWGRADMEFYFASLAWMENWLIDKRGILRRRPPTTYATQYTESPAFYPFLDGDGRRVVIIALSDRFEFMIDGALVQDGGSTFTLAHSYGADYRDLRVEPDTNISYIFHPNHANRSIQVSGSIFEIQNEDFSPFDLLNDDTSCTLRLFAGGSSGSLTAFMTASDPVTVPSTINLRSSGGGVIFQADVDVDLGGQVYEITLSSSQESGTYNLVDGPTDPVVIEQTVQIAVENATLSAVGCAPFTADMVGQDVRILDENGDSESGASNNTWLVLEILAFVSTTEVTVGYSGDEIVATSFFQLPRYVGGVQPETGVIFDGRLWLAAGNRVQGSEAEDFSRWRPTDEEGNTNPDNAIYRRIAGGTSGNIFWMAPMGRQLVVGAQRGLFSLLGSGVSGAFQADATAQQKNERVSCADRRPVEVAAGLLFIDGSRRQLKRAEFAGQYDQVGVVDQTLFADHFGRYDRMTYAESPYSIAWACTDEGLLLSHTVVPGQQVRGWGRHKLGGYLDRGGVRGAPLVRDVHAVPSIDGDDWVYVAVERTLGGSNVFSVEYMRDVFREGDDYLDAGHLDCGLRLSSTVSGSVSFENGPEGTSNLADGTYAGFDGERWTYFTVSGFAATAETPNTQEEPVPGRDWVNDGTGWVKLAAAQEFGEPAFAPSTSEVWRAPREITEIREVVETGTGADHLDGEDVTVFVDGNPFVRSVSGGQVGIGGAVARVGFSYDSRFDFLPFRGNLGATDGANDPVRVIEGALLLRSAFWVEAGTGRRNDYREESMFYERIRLPETGVYRPEPWAGWQTFNPFADLTDNDVGLCSIAARGPYPCTVAGSELTLEAYGGR